MRDSTARALLAALLFTVSGFARSEEIVPRGDKTTSWLLLQAFPNEVVLASPQAHRFGFEWEVTPLIYSFGMTKLVSPWHSFFVVPTERFSGSIELVASGLLFTRQLNGTNASGSVQLLGHLPLVERGEHLGLNIGAAKYWYGNSSSLFVVGGVSTLFGLVHFNARYSIAHHVWLGSLEFRFF